MDVRVWPHRDGVRFSQTANPIRYESCRMKLPLQTLAVLMLFVGAPFGLMHLTTRAIEAPKTYPLMSTVPTSGFAFYSSVGKSLNKAIAPKKLPYLAVNDSVRQSKAVTELLRFQDYIEIQHNEWFASSVDTSFSEFSNDGLAWTNVITPASQRIPGLVAATGRALATSWTKWQPTLVALPDRLRELRSTRMGWTNRAEVFVASLAPVATRSPLPRRAVAMDALFVQDTTSISNVLFSTAKRLTADVSRSLVFPSVRLAARAASKLPNPAIDMSRWADGWRTQQSEWVQAVSGLLRSSVDNR